MSPEESSRNEVTPFQRRPSFIVRTVTLPSLYLSNPPSNVPVQRLPSRVSVMQLIRSLERPSCAERLVNFPSRNRQRPPPYVPIQKLPSLSSNTACTSPTGSPFSGMKYSTVSIAVPVGPSRNVIRP